MSRRVIVLWLGIGLGVAASHCASESSSDPQPGPDAATDVAPSPAPSDRDGAAPVRDAADADGEVEEAVTNPSPMCKTLCVALMQTCVHPEHVQFQSVNACLRACQFYPIGLPGEFLGNSLTCRIEHVEDADETKGGRIGHCGHAGAFGWNGCGDKCESFCQLAMGWCPKSKTGAPFPSLAVCREDCETFNFAPARPNDVYQFNAYGPPTGDSIDCRAYQLIASLEGPAARDEHCPLAATQSAACR